MGMNLKALHYHKVRALRNTLKKQFCLGKISAGEKRKLGRSISGNVFKTRKALIEQIIKNKNAAKETKATTAARTNRRSNSSRTWRGSPRTSASPPPLREI